MTDADRETLRWWSPTEPDPKAELYRSLRAVQDRSVATRPPDDVIAAAAAMLDEVARSLEPWMPDDPYAPVGSGWTERPRRQKAFTPLFTAERAAANSVTGSVHFSPFHHGGGGAAHGGAVTLLFDELLGAVANGGGRPRSRTAYLHVDYRGVTPLDVALQADVSIVREEGRKIVVSGVLRNGEHVLAEAEGLFVTLRPGQP